MNTEEPANKEVTDADRTHLLDLSRDELREWIASKGEKPFRAEQLLEWIYAKKVADFEQMTSISKMLRQSLIESADVFQSTIARESVASDGTRKLLLQWQDRETTETVWIPDGDRNTVCVSSQVGCAVGCKFCASGLNGFQRNLTAGEIVEQVLRIAHLVRDQLNPTNDKRGPRLSNVVIMGMGEPLANYEAVIKAIRIINAPWGLNIGARKITLSTVGLPKQIRRLAEEDLQITLALSLHAPDQKLRQEIIPWAKGPMSELFDACSYYFQTTGREVTLEYALLAGVNDKPEHAVKLAKIAAKLRANINLIRYNPVPGVPFQSPSNTKVAEFQQLLQANKANVHLRKSRGQDIDAACGQLKMGSSTPLISHEDAS